MFYSCSLQFIPSKPAMVLSFIPRSNQQSSGCKSRWDCMSHYEDSQKVRNTNGSCLQWCWLQCITCGNGM